MKNYLFLFASILLLIPIQSCMREEKDREKIVEMILYAEPTYGGSILSDIWTIQIVFSDSDDHEKQTLSDIIVEDFDYEYQPGYEYRLKARKIWMHNPPQDVLPIKYEILEFLSKKKIITEDRSEIIQLIVSPEKVRFMPRFPYIFLEEGGLPVVIEALRTQNPSTLKSYIIPEIKDFTFEPGYKFLTLVINDTT